MDSSGVNNELIERLLNVNKLSKNEQADSTAELGDAPFNFTPDQLEMLANVSFFTDLFFFYNTKILPNLKGNSKLAIIRNSILNL